MAPHDFQFEISNSGTQKSELPIHAYFKIASTASGADNDADISYSGTYEAGDLDYTYNDGPLLTNQIVTIPSPITASSTGSITLSVYDDILYELDENESFINRALFLLQHRGYEILEIKE